MIAVEYVEEKQPLYFRGEINEKNYLNVLADSSKGDLYIFMGETEFEIDTSIGKGTLSKGDILVINQDAINGKNLDFTYIKRALDC